MSWSAATDAGSDTGRIAAQRTGHRAGCGARRRSLASSAVLRLAAVVVAVLPAGCSMTEHDNRRTLNLLDEKAAPAAVEARWALSPVALPAGLVALLCDMVVVHPACSIDDAWGDTVEWLWTPRDETRFRRAVIIPLATIATPLVFVGDWIGRCLLPIDPRKDDKG